MKSTLQGNELHASETMGSHLLAKLFLSTCSRER